MRHVLTNVVGARDETEVEIGERALQSGEILLLCSDGLHGTLDDATMQLIVGGGGDVADMAERLIAAALDRNASDNVTALLVRIHRRSSGRARPGSAARADAAVQPPSRQAPQQPLAGALDLLHVGPWQVHVQRAAARLIERRHVAERLRQLEDAEGERLAGYRHVGARRGEDQEDARVRAALVQLPGGVQVARTVAEHRGAAGAPADLARGSGQSRPSARRSPAGRRAR